MKLTPRTWGFLAFCILIMGMPEPVQPLCYQPRAVTRTYVPARATANYTPMTLDKTRGNGMGRTCGPPPRPP